jgi:hypothetical protein
MAMAIESGRATMATVKPASASALKSAAVYPSRSNVTSFGVNNSAKLGAGRLGSRAMVVSMTLLSFALRNPRRSKFGQRTRLEQPGC